MSEEQLLVRRIKEGTVIDHIDAGKALLVLRALNITGKEGNTVTVAMNVPSMKLGKKDIIKIENRSLTSYETDEIALIAPHATINIISEYKIREKWRVELPDELIGIFDCPNSMCVSNLLNPLILSYSCSTLSSLHVLPSQHSYRTSQTLLYDTLAG
jgi:aspartate carbamoyltransferase regulatory subunit